MTKKEILIELIAVENLITWDEDRMSGDGREGLKLLKKLRLKLAHEVEQIST